jgi:hypothetical protein
LSLRFMQEVTDLLPSKECPLSYTH